MGAKATHSTHTHTHLEAEVGRNGAGNHTLVQSDGVAEGAICLLIGRIKQRLQLLTLDLCAREPLLLLLQRENECVEVGTMMSSPRRFFMGTK